MIIFFFSELKDDITIRFWLFAVMFTQYTFCLFEGKILNLPIYILVNYVIAKGQLISKCLLVSSILPKNERKQFDLSSKVDFYRSFFGRIEDTKKTFRN